MKRRDVLKVIGTAGLSGLGGCNTDPSTTTETSSSTSSGTPSDDQAPTILLYESEPLDNGQRLAVRLKGEDNNEIEEALVRYGERILREHPEGRQVDLDGVLDEIPDAEPTFPGQVVYALRDTAGNETEKTAYADEKAPILTVTPRTTQNAGELELLLEGEDGVGLHELRTELNGGSETVENLTGRKDVSLQQTVTADQYDSLTPGEMNSVEAILEDAMGNTTRKQVEQSVRKYDKMEETRLNLGAVYLSHFPLFTNIDSCEGREPAVGTFDHQYPDWVFDHHLDQMSGFGVERVLINYNGDNRIETQIKRFLENTDLINTVALEPKYNVTRWYWSEDATEPNDDLLEDVLKPHMDWIHENLLSHDNIATFKGRPLMHIWHAHAWKQDYIWNKIQNEFGGFPDFVEEMRSLLHVDGKDPFIVAETGPLGYHGYPGSRQKKIAKQFDATGTWVGGRAWKESEPHNFATQEEALKFVEQNFQGNKEFIDDKDLEFVPMAFPGFNERGCPEQKPDNRKTPRSLEFFRNTLELAEEYRTTDMVNLAPYNNWLEGTQITPGTFKGNDYGTTYLELLREFQSN